MKRLLLGLVVCSVGISTLVAGSAPVRARKGMVLSEDRLASAIGADVLREGGTAVDAAIATAFALAVTFPSAGNIGGGGFLVYRPASGDSIAYDFREVAPPGSSPDMFLKDGQYDSNLHHLSHLVCRSSRDRGRIAPGLVRSWKASVEAAGRAGNKARSRRVSGFDGAGAIAQRASPFRISLGTACPMKQGRR